MTTFLDISLIFIFIISAGFAIFYSIRRHSYRKSQNEDGMYLSKAKSNISMGIMLLTLAFIQLFAHADSSGLRTGIGFIFFMLGGVNLFLGIRNYRYFESKFKNN